MGTITIKPKNVAEFKLLLAMFEKMKIKVNLNLTDEEKEDLGMAILMEEVDWNDTIPVDEFLSELKKRKSVAA
jgi:hypothetical protein